MIRLMNIYDTSNDFIDESRGLMENIPEGMQQMFNLK